MTSSYNSPDEREPGDTPRDPQDFDTRSGYSEVNPSDENAQPSDGGAYEYGNAGSGQELPPDLGPVGPRYGAYIREQPRPYLRPHGSSGLAAVSLVLGVFSFFFMTVGLSFFFASLGILLALLSRGSGRLSGQARLGIGISCAGFLGGIVALAMAASVLFGSIRSGEFQQQFSEYYEQYMNGGEDPLDEELPDLDFDFGSGEGNTI